MGEKKRRLAAREAGQSPHFGELIAQGLRAREAGDLEGADRAFSALLSRPPEEPDALNASGVLGLRIGRHADAEKLLLAAIARTPDEAAYHVNLGIAYRRLGRPALAVEQLQSALNLDPGVAEAHANLGNVLLDMGQVLAALASFERALAIRRDYADALNGLGSAQRSLGRFASACENLERAVAIDPSFHEAYSNLAVARTAWAVQPEPSSDSAPVPVADQNAKLGLEAISTALRLCPENPVYWAQFADGIKHFDLEYPVSGSLRELLSRALDHPAVNPASLARPVSSLVSSHTSVAELRRQLSAARTFEAVEWPTVKQLVADFFGEALLLRLLEDVVYPNALLERVVTFARRATLREILDRQSPSLPLAVLVTIAHQCFNAEYVYDESAEEVSGIERLSDELLRLGNPENRAALHWYAIYASYRPLHSLAQAEQIAGELEKTPLRSLAVRQIREPLEERRLRAEIPALTGVAGEVSRAVQTQYESNPYPRWVRAQRNFVPNSVRAVLGGLFPLADLGGVVDGPARVLVAGCGSGQHPIDTAQRFRDSSVLAVDLSLASLAYAVRKTRELGVKSIEYRQADLLALGSLPERFDVIECSGVLHHLEDPEAGWRVLCSLLRPGGVMRIGLYSALARAHVLRARQFIAEHGFEATPEGIRECRAAVFARADDELLAKLTRRQDFYSMSGCRDLIFHVQEQRFTLPQIAGMIERLKLAFIGFELPEGGSFARYRDQFPDDAALCHLENWHRFETASPDTFQRMYQFWTLKPV